MLTITKTKNQITALTGFVCMSNANEKSLFSKTIKNAENKKTIAIGDI
jgi:hypothetical protein